MPAALRVPQCRQARRPAQNFLYLQSRLSLPILGLVACFLCFAFKFLCFAFNFSCFAFKPDAVPFEKPPVMRWIF